jgi:hypothetical protein
MEIFYIIGIVLLVIAFGLLGVACIDADPDNWRENNYFGDKK